MLARGWVLVLAAMLSGCPSLGPTPVACRDDADCPSSLALCTAGFCEVDDGGHTTFCTREGRGHQFCADFEDDPTFSLWSTRDSMVELDSTLVASGRFGMTTNSTPMSGGCVFRAATRHFDGGLHGATVEFDVRMDGETYGPFGAVAFDEGVDNGHYCNAVFSDIGGKMRILEQAGASGSQAQYSRDHNGEAVLARDEWAHLTLDYDVAARRVVLQIDGGTVIDAGFFFPCPFVSTVQRVTVRLGVYCAMNTAVPLKLSFDNVTADTR